MANEAPVVNASAAEDAATKNVYTTCNALRYDVYTDDEGYQFHESLSTQISPNVWIDVPETTRYMTGGPGAWGGYNGVPHRPHRYEEEPFSIRTILLLANIKLEDTRCFQGRERCTPLPAFVDGLREDEKVMPFPKHAKWTGGKEKLPSLKSWGPEGPPPHYVSFYPAKAITRHIKAEMEGRKARKRGSNETQSGDATASE